MSDAKYSPLGKLSALQQVQDDNPDESSNEREVTTPSWKDVHGSWSKVRLGNTGIRVSPLGIGVALLLVFSLGYYTVSSPVAMKSNEQEVSIKELIKASIEFAERGGNILVDIRKQADIGEQSKGAHDDVAEGPGSNDPVTQGDFQSHMAMTFAFKKYFPTIHVVSEEKTEKPDMSTIAGPHLRNREVDRIITEDKMYKADDITIWIDPLDATQEYTESLTQYVTTMVCIVQGDEPIAAVIHKPFENSFAWAWTGNGGVGNLENKSNDAPSNSVIVSRSHAGNVKDIAQKGLGNDVTVIPAGGAGYKAWALFDGTAQAYVHTTLIKKWDICPGDAILRAYGGKMTRLNGDEIKYGYQTDPKNEGGMIAALNDYEKFQAALKDAFGA